MDGTPFGWAVQPGLLDNILADTMKGDYWIQLTPFFSYN